MNYSRIGILFSVIIQYCLVLLAVVTEKFVDFVVANEIS